MYKTLHTKIYDASTLMTSLRDFMVSVGWVLIDTVSENSDLVFMSDGETPLVSPMYVRIVISGVYMRYSAYGYWNSTTHVGVNPIAIDKNIFYKTISVNYCWDLYFSGDKNYIALTGGVYSMIGVVHSDSCMFGTFPNPLSQYVNTCSNSVSPGTNLSLQLDKIDGLIVGNKCVLYDKNNTIGYEVVSISNVDTATNIVTLLSVVGNYPNGCYLGYNVFPWFYSYGLNVISSYGPITNLSLHQLVLCNNSGNSNTTQDTTLTQNNSNFLDDFVCVAYRSPIIIGMFNDNLKYNTASTFQTLSRSVIVFNNHAIPPKPTSFLSYVNNQDLSYVTDIRQNWPVNSLAGKYFVLTSGYGLSQSRKIASNTSDTIVFENNLLDVPAKGSGYLISDSVYRCHTPNNFWFRDIF